MVDQSDLWSPKCKGGGHRFRTKSYILPILFSASLTTEWWDKNYDRSWNQDFFPKPNFPKPTLRLFFRDEIFRNRDFFQKPNYLRPKLCIRDQFFWNRNWYIFSETKFSEADSETIEKLAKVSKPKCHTLLLTDQKA